MIHIWHEDNPNSSTTQFWQFLKSQNVKPILNNADIRGFSGNVNFYNQLQTTKFNPKDKYYIFIDYVPDNTDAHQVYSNAKRLLQPYKNVKLMKLRCFEYLILKFRYLVNWIEPVKIPAGYANEKAVRLALINILDAGGDWRYNSTIMNYIMDKKHISLINWTNESQYITSEDVIAALLTDMTAAGKPHEFTIKKTTFGRCWHENCCYQYTDAYGSKRCRLYAKSNQKTPFQKAKELWSYTEAHNLIK